MIDFLQIHLFQFIHVFVFVLDKQLLFGTSTDITRTLQKILALLKNPNIYPLDSDLYSG